MSCRHNKYTHQYLDGVSAIQSQESQVYDEEIDKDPSISNQEKVAWEDNEQYKDPK